MERSSGALTVRSGREGEDHHVSLAGELDLASVELVAEQVRQATAGDASRVVLDLRGLEFIDSTGIQLLLTLDSESRENGGRLRVTRSSKPVERVLRLTGVDVCLPYLE